MTRVPLTLAESQKLCISLRRRGIRRFAELFHSRPSRAWVLEWRREYQRCVDDEKEFKPALDALQRGKKREILVDGLPASILLGDPAKKLRALLKTRGIDLDRRRWSQKAFASLPNAVQDILLNCDTAAGYQRRERRALRSEDFPMFDLSHWPQFVIASFAWRPLRPLPPSDGPTWNSGARDRLYLMRPRDMAQISYIVRVERRGVDSDGPNARIKEDGRELARIIEDHWGYSKSDREKSFAPRGRTMYPP